MADKEQERKARRSMKMTCDQIKNADGKYPNHIDASRVLKTQPALSCSCHEEQTKMEKAFGVNDREPEIDLPGAEELLDAEDEIDFEEDPDAREYS